MILEISATKKEMAKYKENCNRKESVDIEWNTP
jgi:hypothetical protein